MSRPAMIPNNANYHGLQHEPANRDDLREWRRMAMSRTTHSNGIAGNIRSKSANALLDIPGVVFEQKTV